MHAIELKDVTKAFQLGARINFLDSMRSGLARLKGLPPPVRKVFKALDGVSLCIDRGEVVGIIGQNGAGKSTLLKLICGITNPTTGSVNAAGKIAPLIEVGAGLHPELTGRENIYLNGSILGISRGEIAERVDDIISFAELEEFADTPVKRYSSGMRVRLGFSIATSVEADILIVDEVLAVGDLAFQRKCFSRMEEAIKRREQTVLLVSHNLRQIERMCDRVILLDRGTVIEDGPAKDVCNEFYRRSNAKVLGYQSEVAAARVSTSGEVELKEIEVLDDEERVAGTIAPHSALRVRVRFMLKERLVRPALIIGTHTTDFVYLTSSTLMLDHGQDLDAGEHIAELTLPQCPLAPGVYCIRFAVLDCNGRIVYVGEMLKTFTVDVTQDSSQQAGPRFRLVLAAAEWNVDGRRFRDAGGSVEN